MLRTKQTTLERGYLEKLADGLGVRDLLDRAPREATWPPAWTCRGHRPCDHSGTLPERQCPPVVDTDRPIKLLFERQGQSLLPFIGEAGARVTAAESVTLSVPRREVDCVLRLEREGAVWYRHLEFQSGPDPDMARRCFEYNCRLILHYNAAVLTTVLYLFPGADSGAVDAFRLHIGERLAYEWSFEVVRLWEISVNRALQSGETGPLALVPLLQGGDVPEKVEEAARRLVALPMPESADAMSVLIDLASQRYDRATLRSMLGKERIMQSYLWQMGLDEGEAKGEAKGEVQAARQICVDLAKAFHHRLSKRVFSAIQACDQPATLRAWILECPKLSEARFAELVTGKPTPPKRSRTSHPSRDSRRTPVARKAR